MFTVERLMRLCPHADPLIVYAIVPVLERDRIAVGIVTILRGAHFIAQIAHESENFTHLSEDLNYSAPRIKTVFPHLAPRADELAHNPEKLGNAAYGDHLGNGNEASGDGFRFRGRGLIEMTGRANYSFFGAKIGQDLQSDPDRVADPAIGAQVALAFWDSRKCNQKADLDNVEGVTRLINGPALEGIDARRALTAAAKSILSEAPGLIA